VISWSLRTGEVCRQVLEGNQQVAALKWLAGQYLLAIFPPNHLLLLDMASGTKVWKKSFSEPLFSFDLDPFNPMRLLLVCPDSLLLVEDLSTSKCPKSEGRRWCAAAAAHSEAQPEGSSGRGGSTRLRRMVRSMVLGSEPASASSTEKPCSDPLGECLQASFNPCVPEQVLAIYRSLVLLLSSSLLQPLGSLSLERAHSPLAALIPARQQDALYLLHESGSLSVWGAKEELTQAPQGQVSKSQSFTSFPGTPGASPAPHSLSDSLLEISYESKATSDHVRLGKNSKVLGFSMSPVTQSEVAFLTTDGRLFFANLRQLSSSDPPSPVPHLSSLDLSKPLRLSVSGMHFGVTSPLTCVRMCPPLTIKNWGEYRPLLAVGTQNGHVSIINVSSGVVEVELALHTSQVSGIEWTSSSPAASVLSYACCPVTGGGGSVRNELLHTEVRSGRSRSLRSQEREEARISMIRVSQLRQYFIVAFQGAPFELWDLTNLCVLRTMPKKFPGVSALEWSPFNSRAGKKKEDTPSSREGSLSPVGVQGKTAKEQILLTDMDGQLYHFTVEGHSIRDGTKIPAETGLGTIHTIAWKGDLIVRGDSEGNINIWNIKKRQSKNIHTGRGVVLKMKFSPGKNNLKVLALFQDSGVQIWDVKELELINELRSPGQCVPNLDCDWAASDRIVLAGSDGSLRMVGLALAGTSSPVMAYGREQPLVCSALLPPQLFKLLAFLLSVSPPEKLEEIRAIFEDENATVVNSFLDSLSEEFYNYLGNEKTPVTEKYLNVCLAMGLGEEAKLWEYLGQKEAGAVIGKQYHVFAGEETFKARAEELCQLHMPRCCERSEKVRLTSQLVCLGLLEPAVTLLLDSDPQDPNFMSDQLLACLIQATSPSADVHSAPNHISTMKMVATTLLSEARLWEGVQLLVLAGKVLDACSYLRDALHWNEALWLGRCRLGEEEFRGLVAKYAEYQQAKGATSEAVLALLSIDSVENAVRMALDENMIFFAAKLMLWNREKSGTLSEDVQSSVINNVNSLVTDMCGEKFTLNQDILGKNCDEEIEVV